MKKIKTDIKTVYSIGNEILATNRLLDIAKSKDDYDTCIKLRKKLEDLKNKRDTYDVVYETSRYEKMIVMRRPTTADLLADEEYKLKLERERLERERLEKERLERLRREELDRQKVLDDDLNNTKKIVDRESIPSKKFVDYVPQNTKKIEKDLQLQYNQGDKDLEPYFGPLARDGKRGDIPTPDISKLKKALRQGVLLVTGVRLYSALIGDNWKMREAAVMAFLEFLQNPLLPRYVNKTKMLFEAAVEVSKFACEDKVIQIYLEGLKILATALSPPVCGNDIDPTLIQKSVHYFIPKYIKKISELNYRARDLTLNTLISIFKHPALNIGDLVKGCMDIVERQDGVTPDKQPWNILLARLEIILHILEDYGIDEALWDWYPVFTELIIPSLFHQNPDCRLVGIEICVLLYKLVGDDIKIIINDLNNLKPNLKETINNRMNEVDTTTKKDIAMQSKSLKKKINNNSNSLNKSKKKSPNDSSLEPIIESNIDV